MFVTVLHMGEKEMAFRQFKSLCDLQTKNGLNLFTEGKQSKYNELLCCNYVYIQTVKLNDPQNNLNNY